MFISRQKNQLHSLHLSWGIAKGVLQWVLCLGLSKYTQHVYLHAKNKLYQYFFSEDIAKILPISYFGYFGQVWSLANLQKLRCLSACKKMNSISTFFFRYCKDIPNLLLWVLSKCLIMPINTDGITLQETLMPKVLKLICRKLRYLSACKR